MKHIGAYHGRRRGEDAAALSALLAALDEADALGDTVLRQADCPPAWREAAARSPLLRLEGDWIWLERQAAAEEDLARQLRRLLQQEEDAPTADEFEAVQDLRQDLNADQRRALDGALRKRFLLINGGPGTGKTYTLARIVQALLRRNPSLRWALCAPTGKAAQRMQESLQRAHSDLASQGEAFTVHRLLAYQHGRFQHHAGRPLPYDLIIVDEASMLSLELARALLAAVAPGCRLILLGDAHQLAAVEAGAVLRDMLQSPLLAGYSVTLTESKRFGEDSAIGRWARAALAGENSDWPRRDFQDAEALLRPFQPYFAALQQDAPLAELWRHFEAHRVLCALRQGAGGTEAINGRAVQHLQALTAAVPGLFQHGLPLMVLANDYRLQLYNGDIGLCLRRGEAFALHFPQREALPAAEFNPQQLSPAFALTIHKSQGSEFDRVALSLPDSAPILSRELLYTGISRAREKLDIYAGRAALRQALHRPSQRRTGLAHFLQPRPC